MDLSKKIDVLDMIIDVLTQHEKSLDASATRLEELLHSKRAFTFTAQAKNHGNSLGINILKPIKNRLNIQVGDTLEVTLRRIDKMEW